MSIESYIESLKGKPEHIRKRYAFWSAFGITMVIFTFWLNSFSVFSNKTQDIIANTVGKVGTPVQSITASVGAFFTDIGDIFFGPKKVTYTNVEVVAGKK